MAEKYGAKWIFGVGTLLAAILTLVAPLASDFGASAFIIVRVLEGLGEVWHGWWWSQITSILVMVGK